MSSGFKQGKTAEDDVSGYWFENHGLTQPYSFNQATLLHPNYHGDIKNDKKNDMGKEVLMAICVGCRFDLRMTQRVLGKQHITLDEFQEPDKTYITLLERLPGIGINQFNELLKRRNIPSRVPEYTLGIMKKDGFYAKVGTEYFAPGIDEALQIAAKHCVTEKR
ncbi:MAG: hypothetical protein J5878_03880 [Oscillospiraceae bacterium]|nr:hypothetical protein [Oscillospiraceae bacterium]